MAHQPLPNYLIWLGLALYTRLAVDNPGSVRSHRIDFARLSVQNQTWKAVQVKTRVLLRDLVAAAGMAGSCAAWGASLDTSIFSASFHSRARSARALHLFVLVITAIIYLGVSTLLIYALVRFRARPGENTEPPQVFGSVQIELAWTIIPILIIVVLFLGTARVLFSVQDARKPATALDVIVVGHQFWWEFRYPQYNVITANELHVPVSSQRSPAHVYEADFGGRDAQLLGSPSGRQDGSCCPTA